MSATETYTPRLKERYEELRPQLKDQLGKSSIMEVPRITKVTLNMGVGEAKTDSKQLDTALEELSIIAGQRAQMRRAPPHAGHFSTITRPVPATPRRKSMPRIARGYSRLSSSRTSRRTPTPLAPPS